MQPLSIGGVVARSFVAAARNLPALAAIAIAAAALLKAVEWLAFRTDPFLLMPPRGSVVLSPVMAALQALPGQYIYNLALSAMAWIVFSALDGGRTVAERFGAWARALVPLLVLESIFAVLSMSSIPLLLAMQDFHPSASLMMLKLAGLLIWLVIIVTVALSWWVAPVTAVAEGRGAIAAIRRSVALTKGNRGRILMITLILAAATIGPEVLLMMLSGTGYPPRVVVPLWTPLGATAQALQTLFFVLYAASAGAIYFDLRNMKDPAAQAETFA
jgi:hypothetical protein